MSHKDFSGRRSFKPDSVGISKLMESLSAKTSFSNQFITCSGNGFQVNISIEVMFFSQFLAILTNRSMVKSAF